MVGSQSVKVLSIKSGALLALQILHLSSNSQKRTFDVMVGSVASRLNRLEASRSLQAQVLFYMMCVDVELVESSE